MAIDYSFWKKPFEFKEFPKWVCPKCLRGNLNLDENTFQSIEPTYSVAWHNHDDFEPDWVCERFVGLLKCNNKPCGEIVSISGNTIYDYDKIDERQWGVVPFSVPTCLCPAPPVFVLIDDVPDSVAEDVKKSFELFWSDTASCVNKIRVSLERLLDEEGVTQSTPDKRMTLHQRIQEYESKDSESAKYLMALKWVGNTGSHSSNIDIDKVLEAFELLEHSLIAVFKGRKLRKIRDEIIENKG
ncbi:MAG: DUF4145 domain-containing protein [Magnetococcus sp. YQC-5]